MANDTLEKFKASINRGVTTINVKTTSSLEKVKIKTHIDSLNTEIKRLSLEVGEKAYELWENEVEDRSELNEYFLVIQKLKGEVLELETESMSIDERDKQILGTKSAEGSEANSDADQGEQKVICSNCGTVYDGPKKFCVRCGQNLQEQ